jgi:hypothetical protein
MVSFSRYFTVCITYQPPLVLALFIFFYSHSWTSEPTQGIKARFNCRYRIRNKIKYTRLLLLTNIGTLHTTVLGFRFCVSGQETTAAISGFFPSKCAKCGSGKNFHLTGNWDVRAVSHKYFVVAIDCPYRVYSNGMFAFDRRCCHYHHQYPHQCLCDYSIDVVVNCVLLVCM